MQTQDERDAAIERMVRSFYQRGLADPVLGPIFREHIHDWEPHIAIVCDFWSGVVHGTGRYKANSFAPHMKLRLLFWPLKTTSDSTGSSSCTNETPACIKSASSSRSTRTMSAAICSRLA